jgi:hypothetical protein
MDESVKAFDELSLQNPKEEMVNGMEFCAFWLLSLLPEA